MRTQFIASSVITLVLLVGGGHAYADSGKGITVSDTPAVIQGAPGLTIVPVGQGKGLAIAPAPSGPSGCAQICAAPPCDNNHCTPFNPFGDGFSPFERGGSQE